MSFFEETLRGISRAETLDDLWRLTVDAHLRSIYRKLDISDRTTAAVRAVDTTLVSFPDREGT